MTKIWQKYEKMSKAEISIFAPCGPRRIPCGSRQIPCGPRAACVSAVNKTSNRHNSLSVAPFSAFFDFSESLREDLYFAPFSII